MLSKSYTFCRTNKTKISFWLFADGCIMMTSSNILLWIMFAMLTYTSDSVKIKMRWRTKSATTGADGIDRDSTCSVLRITSSCPLIHCEEEDSFNVISTLFWSNYHHLLLLVHSSLFPSENEASLRRTNGGQHFLSSFMCFRTVLCAYFSYFSGLSRSKWWWGFRCMFTRALIWCSCGSFCMKAGKVLVSFSYECLGLSYLLIWLMFCEMRVQDVLGV